VPEPPGLNAAEAPIYLGVAADLRGEERVQGLQVVVLAEGVVRELPVRPDAQALLRDPAVLPDLQRAELAQQLQRLLGQERWDGEMKIKAMVAFALLAESGDEAAVDKLQVSKQQGRRGLPTQGGSRCRRMGRQADPLDGGGEEEAQA